MECKRQRVTLMFSFCSALSEGERLKLNRAFFEERWCKNRTVTSMDWSVQVSVTELHISTGDTNHSVQLQLGSKGLPF